MTLLVEIYLSIWVITLWINWTFFWIFPNWFALIPVRLFRLDVARFHVNVSLIIKPWSVGYQSMPILKLFLDSWNRLKFTWVISLVLFNSHVDTFLLFLYLFPLGFCVIIIYCRLVRLQISCLKVNTFLLNCLTTKHSRSADFLFLHNRLGHHSNRFFPCKLDFNDFFLQFILVILNLIFLIMQSTLKFVVILWI